MKKSYHYQKIKNSSVTIRLKPKDELELQKAQEIKYNLEYTNLDITENISICFDPDIETTNITEDTELVNEYFEFENQLFRVVTQ